MSTAPLPELPPDESRGYIVDIVGWVGAAISTIFVLLRIYSRLFITRSPGWDDTILVFSAILNLITTALNTVAIRYGIGRHIYYLSDDDMVNTLYYGAILRPFGITAYCLPKLAVVILIIKLMGTAKRGIWFLYTVIAILFITTGLSVILLFAQCDPPDHLWHPLSRANCFPNHILDAFTYLAGSWSAFTDFVLAVFPVTVFWNLQIKRSKKIAIVLLMGLGFFAMIAAVIKTTQLPANHAEDATWDLFGLFISTYVETNLVIMAACAPALPKLALRILGKDTEVSPIKGPGSYNKKPVSHESQEYQAFDSQHNLNSISMDNMHGGHSGRTSGVPWVTISKNFVAKAQKSPGGSSILQDLPSVLAQIQHIDAGIECMAYDFYTEQPVKGSKAYYMHSVLHDWPDDVCHKILARVMEAMPVTPGYSSLLINENVIPATGADWQAGDW